MDMPDSPTLARVDGNSPTLARVDRDSLTLARVDRENQGQWEAEYSYGGEADLHRHYDSCIKNPGHKNYIPVDKFSIDDLPDGYRDTDIMDYIRSVSDLTVRVTVKYVSDRRPENVPGTDSPYPGYADRGQEKMTVGTGWVHHVNVSCGSKGGTCKCNDCQSSSTPETKFAIINIATATHVAFDDQEGEHATCHLFFDHGSTPDSCSGVITLTGMSSRHSNIETDWCYLRHFTHDLNLAHMLQQKCILRDELMRTISTKLPRIGNCKRTPSAVEKQPLLFIVSHPHGCRKHISVGRWISVCSARTDVFCYQYTTATCPGSSGAHVYMPHEFSPLTVNAGWSNYPGSHCGASDVQPGVNYCHAERDYTTQQRNDASENMLPLYGDYRMEQHNDASENMLPLHGGPRGDNFDCIKEEDLQKHEDIFSCVEKEDLEKQEDNFSCVEEEVLQKHEDNFSSVEEEDLQKHEDNFSSVEEEDLQKHEDNFSSLEEKDLQKHEDNFGCVEEEALQKHYDTCQQNLGHQNFVPANEFSMTNLPPFYRKQEIMEFIKIVSAITVHLSTKNVSEARPKTVPGTNILYPWYNKKGSNQMRVGNGGVTKVVLCQDEQFQRNRCRECGSALSTKGDRAYIYIGSAVHLIYDRSEGEHATCRLFFDSVDQCNNGVTLANMTHYCRDVTKDRCNMVYVTSDLNLANRLKKMRERYEMCLLAFKDLLNRMDKEMSASEEIPVHIVVSHPNGRAKQISVSYDGNHDNADTDENRRGYSSMTCPCSIGAPVIVLGWEYSYPCCE